MSELYFFKSTSASEFTLGELWWPLALRISLWIPEWEPDFRSWGCPKGEMLFFKKKKINFYLFLAVLGLHCCMQIFSSCSERGLLLIMVQGFSLQRLLWLQGTVSGVLHRGWVAPQHVGSSQIRGGTCVPCVGGWILNYWTAREAPGEVL